MFAVCHFVLAQSSAVRASNVLVGSVHSPQMAPHRANEIRSVSANQAFEFLSRYGRSEVSDCLILNSLDVIVSVFRMNQLACNNQTTIALILGYSRWQLSANRQLTSILEPKLIGRSVYLPKYTLECIMESYNNFCTNIFMDFVVAIFGPNWTT